MSSDTGNQPVENIFYTDIEDAVINCREFFVDNNLETNILNVRTNELYAPLEGTVTVDLHVYSTDGKIFQRFITPNGGLSKKYKKAYKFADIESAKRYVKNHQTMLSHMFLDELRFTVNYADLNHDGVQVQYIEAVKEQFVLSRQKPSFDDLMYGAGDND